MLKQAQAKKIKEEVMINTTQLLELQNLHKLIN
jgi:hypothetical protein